MSGSFLSKTKWKHDLDPEKVIWEGHDPNKIQIISSQGYFWVPDLGYGPLQTGATVKNNIFASITMTMELLGVYPSVCTFRNSLDPNEHFEVSVEAVNWRGLEKSMKRRL